MPAAFSENSICPLVIVGSGFASFCLAAHLLRGHPERASDITIIGPEPFGNGAAYSCSHPDFRLNVRAQIMRIFPDRPTDFRKWAETEIDDIAAHNPQGAFYRRKDFARYLFVLRHQLSGFDKLNRFQMRLSLRIRQIISAAGTGHRAKTTAKALVLATGNSPPRWPCQLASDLPADRLVENPGLANGWPNRQNRQGRIYRWRANCNGWYLQPCPARAYRPDRGFCRMASCRQNKQTGKQSCLLSGRITSPLPASFSGL